MIEEIICIGKKKASSFDLTFCEGTKNGFTALHERDLACLRSSHDGASLPTAAPFSYILFVFPPFLLPQSRVYLFPPVTVGPSFYILRSYALVSAPPVLGAFP